MSIAPTCWRDLEETALSSETQLPLFGISDIEAVSPALPSTRYQGSKAKLMPWIWEHLKRLDFRTVLDAFGGSGVVSYWLKRHGKQVVYNDYLLFNYYVGLAIIENDHARLSDQDVQQIGLPATNRVYRHFIEDTFRGVYYTDTENAWLDLVTQNIDGLDDVFKKSLGYYALFQSCLVKRPFNLFHRSNLYLRLADVPRSFGNKTTWDRPFQEHFRGFVNEVNSLVFCNGLDNRALNEDALAIEGRYDLVYLDPPYTSAASVTLNYLDFYHFLEGLVNYDTWEERIDYSTKHRRLLPRPNIWNDASRIREGFRAMFEKFRESILVVSYRSDGMPSVESIVRDMRLFKKRVSVARVDGYRYALSPRTIREVLVIGE
ncbi:MAG: DNA adenine methylase [Chloroflexi bacterium]|nr:DNA adenine methylase [Chloroflexota bacterium]